MKNGEKSIFFNGQLEHVTLSIAAFFNSKSEKAETLDLEVSSYGLSSEILQLKISKCCRLSLALKEAEKLIGHQKVHF